MSDRNPVLIRAAGRTLAIGAIVGGEAAAPNVAVRRVASAAEAFLNAAHDVRQSLAGPAQRGSLIAEKSGPLLKAINDASSSILAHHSSVRVRMSAPVFTSWSGTVPPYHEAQTSLILAERFYGASPADRARLLAGMADQPEAHLDWIRALVQTPRAVSGIGDKQAAALGALAFKATKPAEFEALKVEQEQLQIATGAVRQALDITRDAGADLSAMATLAPAAAELLKAEPLRWVDPRVLMTEG